MFLVVAMITNKGESQEVQWIYGWEIRALSDLLNTGKDIICIGIGVIGTRPGKPLLTPYSPEKDIFL